MSQFLPPYPFIKQQLFAGQVVPFLGAGASLRGACGVWHECLSLPPTTAQTCYYDAATCPGFKPPPAAGGCLPKTHELACHLARQFNFPKREPVDLAKVAQYSSSVATGRAALNEELHKIFAQDYAFGPLHELLASVTKPQLIITTNYDDLIERAFQKVGRAYDLVIHTTDPEMGYHILYWPHGAPEPEEVVPNKVNVDLDTTTVIYKIHGAFDPENKGRDQFVITEDDYVDFLDRLARQKVIPKVIGMALKSRPFLFLGYGLRDWNMRVVLKQIAKEFPPMSWRDKSWAIQHKPSELEARFWQERNVEVFDLTTEEFVRNLLA